MGKRGNMKKILTATLLIFQFSPLFSKQDDTYSQVAQKIIDACITHGIKSIGLLPFENKNKAKEEMLSYSFEKLLSSLQKQSDVFVFENSIASIAIEKNSVEGLVIVKAFSNGNNLKTIIKLVRVSDGLVINTQEENFYIDDFIAQSENDKFSLNDAAAEIPEYRDAVRDFYKQDCSERYASIYSKQEDMIEEKARFWAEKLSSPNFSMSNLRRNPGSEIKSQFLKKQFYSLLEYYFKNPKPLNEEEKKRLKELILEEKKYMDECGI